MRIASPFVLYAITLAILSCPPTCHSSQSERTPELIGGARIKLNGTICLERRNNHTFLTIKTSQQYVAIFDPSTDRRNVHEIGLSLTGQEDALEKYVGQPVSVSGTLQLEPASPYYFNGTLILAISVRLPDGSLLLPKLKASVKTLPRHVKQYHALATFSPESTKFSYKVWDADGHPLSPVGGYVSCGVNGAGDVMNCFCANGFKPTWLGKMNGGKFLRVEKSTMDFAQFGIPENFHEPFGNAIECTKKK